MEGTDGLGALAVLGSEGASLAEVVAISSAPVMAWSGL